MRAVTKLRFGILLAGTCLLLLAAALELVTSLESGVSSLPLGRRGAAIQFMRESEPIAFYSCVSLFAAFGLLSLWYVWRQVRALLRDQPFRRMSASSKRILR